MTAEGALYQARDMLTQHIETVLANLDEEYTLATKTPPPRAIKVGSYLGREEILAELPAVTLEARSTTLIGTQEPWQEVRHTLWGWAFAVGTSVEQLFVWAMRYGESLRRVISDRSNWSGYHNPTVTTTMYTNVFQAGHRLVQGCRVEFEVREFMREGG